jgi:tetratricopeptide (TPR) repeat protein
MSAKRRDAAALQAIHNQGLGHHQAGRLDEARRCYEQVLAAEPRHFDALHLLGVYCIQRGQLEPAVERIRQAISVRRDVPDAYGNLANALNSLRRYAEALEASDRAIALNPDFAQAHGNRGQALQQLARFDEALASYDRVVALKPTPQAHFNQATVLRELGRREAALASCDRAIALKPDYAEALRSRGIILCDLGRLQDGLASYDRAIAARPDYVEAWCSRGVALRKLGRPADALASQDQAISLRPTDAEALSNRVGALRELQRPQEALAAADHAVAIRPDHAQAHNVRGVALYDLRRLEEAVETYDRAIAIAPDHAKAHTNKALALYELRRFDEAMASYGQAIALRPDFADAHHNQALCRLMLGDDEAGWAQYEWRWRTETLRSTSRDSGPPAWLGRESLAGRTVLLWAEQGLGDTLQFCRYAPDVAALGAEVILQVQPGMERLAARLSGVAQVVTLGKPAPAHDFQAPLMSLPHALGAGAAYGAEAYLRADPDEIAAWAGRLAGSGVLRIGLCWAGGLRLDQFNANTVDRRRSLPLEAFAPLAGVDGLAIYSLQKGPPAAQLAELQGRGWAGPEIIDPTAELKDLADTAALIANLDLVITCDTAIAHLAGGLGKPVWILNRFDACWRWLTDRDDNPWYPTARLFRQPAPGDWGSVIERVKDQLTSWSEDQLSPSAPLHRSAF